MLTRRLGSFRVMALISVTLVLLMVSAAFAVETMSATPTDDERMLVLVLIAAAGAVFSGGIAVMYVIMVAGYPQSCRSAGIGFGIFMSRVGAISASGFGGALLNLGAGSVIPFFSVLAVCAVLVLVAAFIIDRHTSPVRKAG
jgi:AAHS family 4-hydroxybenzoate transporter-like MFS transporter